MGEETKAEKKGIWSQLWVYTLVAITVIIVLLYLIKPFEETLAATVTQIIIIVFVASSGAIFLLVSHQFKWFNTRTGQIIFSIAVGFLLWTIAESVFLYNSLMGNKLFFGTHDPFYIAGYVPFAIALFLNIRTIKMKFKPLTLIIWIVISVVLFLIILLTEFIPFLMQEISEESLTLIYPAEDFILFVLALVIVLKFQSGEIAKPWALLITGIIFDAIGDIWYTYAEWYGLTLSAYDWYDLFFTLSYIAMFASGLYFLWLYRRQ